jgi:hypothetical protein
MLEKEIKFISDFIISKINDLGSYFTYDELFNSDINPAILKFISAEVDFRIYEDRKKLLHNSLFDYSGSQIAKYFNLIGKEIKKSTKISYNDIKDVVNQAIAFNTDYTITPNEALKNLFFDKLQERKAEEIKLLLNYVYYYPYLKDILNSLVDKKKLSKLSSSELTVILSDIDKELLAAEPEKIIEDVLNTLTDFYNIGSFDKRKLSVTLVESYLKGKNLDKYLKLLKLNTPSVSKQKYEINEIKTFLFSPAVTHDESRPEKEPASIRNESSIELEEEKESPDLSNEELKQSDEKEVEFDITEHNNLEALYNFNEEEPEEQNIEQKKESTLESEKRNIEEEVKKTDEFKAEKEENALLANRQIGKNDEDEKGIEEIEQPKEKKIESIKKPRKKDIFSYLSNKEIEKIVGYIFNDDRDEFASAMEKITETGTYDEATEILKNIFKSYNVNPYSKDAITLTNSVSNYFEQT